MSITKDFEKLGIDWQGISLYSGRDVEKLLAHARALEAMLKSIEKATVAESADPDDPFSLVFVARFGMRTQERMAKLLEGVEDQK